jgi:transposase
MEVVFAHCAGLDVHKKTVVACVFVSNPQGEIQRLIKTFPTTLAGLEALAAWLSGLGVTHVAMESTGYTGSRYSMYWHLSSRCGSSIRAN